jgi:hypothetical protein
MIRKILQAFFGALLDAIRDWKRDRDHDEALRNETTAVNDLEDTRADQEKAERITRAVDAVRTDGNGGMRHPRPGAKPDTRGYRD